MQVKLVILAVVVVIIGGLSATIAIQKLKIDNLSQQLEFQKITFEKNKSEMNKKLSALENKKPEIITKYETITLIPETKCDDTLRNINVMLKSFESGGSHVGY